MTEFFYAMATWVAESAGEASRAGAPTTDFFYAMAMWVAAIVLGGASVACIESLRAAPAGFRPDCW